MLRRLLAHPLMRDCDIDAPDTTELRRRVIAEKPFLHRIYCDWYQLLLARLPSASPVVEIGAGAGFLKELCPEALATDLLPLTGLDATLDAQALPFGTSSIGAFLLINVLHHLPDPMLFFSEVRRCLQPHGRLLLIEPWLNSWSRFVFRRLHPEPYAPEQVAWTFPASGPLSGANTALPWIIFGRDRGRFEDSFPSLRIEEVLPFMPFRYLLSGGVSLRSFLPAWLYPACRGFDELFPFWGMYAAIVIEKHSYGT